MDMCKVWHGYGIGYGMLRNILNVIHLYLRVLYTKCSSIWTPVRLPTNKNVQLCDKHYYVTFGKYRHYKA